MKVIIIGGVAGGASAAARLRRMDETAEIILFERGHYISFANCGLPYYIGDTIQERAKLLVQTPEKMKNRFNIDVRIDSEVIGIDKAAKTVTVKTADGTYTESYDKLVLAPGASPVKHPIPGIDNDNVFTMWSIPDADKVYGYLKNNNVKKAVVVGGGFVGVEMVENLVDRGVEVTLIEMLDQVMNNVDYEIAQWLHMELNDHGVHLMLSEAIKQIDKTDGETVITLASGKTVSTDMIVMSAGIKPNTKLATDAGLEVGARGHIIVDKTMLTSDPDIYALGDAVEVTNYISGERIVAALAAPANKQGRIVANNITGHADSYEGAQLTSVAKIFNKTVASTGFVEKQLIRQGKKLHEDYEVIVAHPNNFAGYYPGNSPLHLKVIYDKTTKKLLGAQGCGEAGTEKRIDVVSTAMFYGGTVYDLMRLDLAYAPPYNTAKDPLNFVGFVAENSDNGLVDIISWKELEQLDADEFQMIDTRLENEVAEGGYPGSIHIATEDLRTNLDKLNKDKTIVLYCRSGVRSYIGARFLSQIGYKVKSMAGGWLSYQAYNYKAI